MMLPLDARLSFRYNKTRTNVRIPTEDYNERKKQST